MPVFRYPVGQRLLGGVTALVVAVACSETTQPPPPPPLPVAQVNVSPPTASMTAGTTLQLQATARDAAGTEIPGVAITWSSDDPSVATVAGTGLVNAVIAGQTSITAQTGSISGTGEVTVVAPGNATISLTPGTTYQTMQGWEATAQIGQSEYNSLWSWSGADFKDVQTELLDRTVNELGIDRVRLEIHPRFENNIDYYTQWQNGTITRPQWKAQWGNPVNDNTDPNVRNDAGFQFSELDDWIVEVVNPMRTLAQANGEQIYVNLCYTDFTLNNHLLKTTPAEYAELVLASFDHINSTYGWVPDAVELVLESDLASYSGALLGNYVVATEARLAAAGYTGVEYVAPSVTNVANAISQINGMTAVSGAQALISEYSYHRYNNPGVSNIQAIAARAAADGKRTSHLEWIGATHTQLLEDLVDGNVSSWSQFTIAWYSSTGTDDGGKYYVVNDANPFNLIVSMGWRTPFLRQYMRYIRRGAVRIGTTNQSGALEPVAFINADGRYVVVVNAASGQGFTVGGLPGGTYGISYSTNSQSNVDQADVTITAGTPLSATIPNGGVITIYGK